MATTVWRHAERVLEAAAHSGIVPSDDELRAIPNLALREYVEAAAAQLVAVHDADGPARAGQVLRNNRAAIVAQLEASGVDPAQPARETVADAKVDRLVEAMTGEWMG